MNETIETRSYRAFRFWYESPEDEPEKEEMSCDNCGRRETCEFTVDECGAGKDFERWVEEE